MCWLTSVIRLGLKGKPITRCMPQVQQRYLLLRFLKSDPKQDWTLLYWSTEIILLWEALTWSIPSCVQCTNVYGTQPKELIVISNHLLHSALVWFPDLQLKIVLQGQIQSNLHSLPANINTNQSAMKSSVKEEFDQIVSNVKFGCSLHTWTDLNSFVSL